MVDLLKPGDSIYHSSLINAKVLNIKDGQVEISAIGHASIPLPVTDFGKTLYLKKEHYIQYPRFRNYKDYLELCEKEQSEKRHKEELKKRAAIEMEERRNEHQNSLTQERNEREYNRFLKILRSKGDFDGLYHYTDFTNFIKIMECGKLYSRNKAKQKDFLDGAEKTVLMRTDPKTFDYVRLYYKEKTPTTYENEGIKMDNSHPHMPLPVILLFNEEIMRLPKRLMTNIWAGSDEKVATKNYSIASKFKWESIFHRSPMREAEKKSIKLSRHAEFLVEDELDLKYLKKIIFRSQADKKMGEALLGKNALFHVDIEKKKFNRHHNFLDDYSVKIEEKYYDLELTFHGGMIFEPLSSNIDSYTHQLKIAYSDKTNCCFDKEDWVEDPRIDFTETYYDYKHTYNLRIKHDKINRPTKLEYFMNGHRSAIWEEDNNA